MTELRAFHNDPAIKAKYIARVEAHRAADELIRGVGWENGKGCAIGCTLDAYDHSRYPIELGLPAWFAGLEDKIFEGLPVERAMRWPSDILRAIPVGAPIDDELRDELAALRLERLLPRLSENTQSYAQQCEAALRQCIGFLRSPSKDESAAESARSAAESARSAAESARSAAKSAAESAAESAWSAESARSAAESARSAAESARSALSARSAARSAAWSAAESAAWSARSAAESAWSARSAARSAAWSAARSAAWETEADTLLRLLAERTMTPSAILYAAADYMREHGFTSVSGYDRCPRCFLGAIASVARRDVNYQGWNEADCFIEAIVGGCGARTLERDGWNTDDAVAALTIAADIAFEDERARGTV